MPATGGSSTKKPIDKISSGLIIKKRSAGMFTGLDGFNESCGIVTKEGDDYLKAKKDYDDRLTVCGNKGFSVADMNRVCLSADPTLVCEEKLLDDCIKATEGALAAARNDLKKALENLRSRVDGLMQGLK